uniref:Uncharacterized protein n=1 Tax=Pristionchus pacificus TaxID=54126 RepID=A0A2A6B5G2_PRIPA|eukprot:PDM61114.1 hypothetical protein PRIPAC_54920 [Pristionchus pacificus]
MPKRNEYARSPLQSSAARTWGDTGPSISVLLEEGMFDRECIKTRNKPWTETTKGVDLIVPGVE